MYEYFINLRIYERLFLNEFILRLLVYYTTPVVQIIISTFYVSINQFKTLEMPKNDCIKIFEHS